MIILRPYSFKAGWMEHPSTGKIEKEKKNKK